ncbi:MAG: hypothetical protein KJZ95_24055 [Caldilinea sp.]|nr:hypothetical protein [Caldilinea sp.]
MMGKSLAAVVVAMMLVVMAAGAVLAQDRGPGTGVGTPGAGLCLNGGDLDGDGVCDNWVDADGDGVNDTAPRDGTGNQYGRGRGQQAGASGQGMNRNGAFVDGNGDGVCDAFIDANGDGLNDAAPRDGSGNQYGRRGH